jgi:hypothetical protein
MSYYHHAHFVRGHRELVRNMVRCKIKGNTMGLVTTTSASNNNSNRSSTKRRCSLDSSTVALATTTTARPMPRRRTSQPNSASPNRVSRPENQDQEAKSVPHSHSPNFSLLRRRRRPCKRRKTLDSDPVSGDDGDHATTRTTLTRPPPSRLRCTSMPTRMISMTMSGPDEDDGLDEPIATNMASLASPPCDGDLVYFEGSPFFYLESSTAATGLLEQDSTVAAATVSPPARYQPTMMDEPGHNTATVHDEKYVHMWSDPRIAAFAPSNRHPAASTTTTATAPWPLFPSLASASEQSEYNEWPLSSPCSPMNVTLSLSMNVTPGYQLRPRHMTTAHGPWEQGTMIQWMC